MDLNASRFSIAGATAAARRAQEIAVRRAREIAREIIERAPPSRALRDIQSLASRFPREARLQLWLGRAFASLDRRRDAEAAYRRALAVDADSEDAVLELADSLLESGRAAEARSLIETFSTRRRFSGVASEARARSLLGGALKALGRFDEAAEEFRKTLELDPGLSWAGRELAEHLCERGQVAGARRILSGLIDRDPLDPHNHGFLGDALRREGKPLEAAEAFRAALWLHPGYAWAARQLAGLLCERGDSAGARSVLCAALESDPDESEEPWLLACLGITEARLGRKRRAEQCFHRCLERARTLPPEPEMPAALDGLLGLILEA